MLPKSLSPSRRVSSYRYLLLVGLLAAVASVCLRAAPWSALSFSGGGGTDFGAFERQPTNVVANADLIAYYNFEGAATSPFPVNATSHAPAFFDGSNPQHSSTLVATNLSSADMSAESDLPLNEIGGGTKALGFHKTANHSPAEALPQK